MQVQKGLDGEGVIFGEAFQCKPPARVPCAPKKFRLAWHPCLVQQECTSLQRPCCPFFALQGPARSGKSRDGKGRPSGHHLVVFGGPTPFGCRAVPPCRKLGHHRGTHRPALPVFLVPSVVLFTGPHEDVPALLPMARVFPVIGLDQPITHLLIGQGLGKVFVGPNVVGALGAIAVGIQR